MDTLDHQMIGLLRNDARLSVAALAHKLQVSRGTVTNRIARLEDQGIIVGYTVRNGLSVRVRDLAKLGGIMDQSVTLGVNEGGNILFTNDDPSGAIEQARTRAVQDAAARAKSLAAAAGVKLGKVLEISEQSYNPEPMPVMRAEMMMAKAADAVPVAAGENSYQVSVNLSYAIEQ